MIKGRLVVWEALSRGTAGAITVTAPAANAPKQGDLVLNIANFSDGGADVTTYFETTITVAGQIQQTGTVASLIEGGNIKIYAWKKR